jgi:hypothetical protein
MKICEEEFSAGLLFLHLVVKTDPAYNLEDPILDIIMKTRSCIYPEKPDPGYNFENRLFAIYGQD